MKISALNPGKWPSVFGDYSKTDLKPDAIAGLTVAVMGVPQAMAYAVIAELPPVYGLYTAMITCLVAAVFGSSRHLVTSHRRATGSHLPLTLGGGGPRLTRRSNFNYILILNCEP